MHWHRNIVRSGLQPIVWLAVCALPISMERSVGDDPSRDDPLSSAARVLDDGKADECLRLLDAALADSSASSSDVYADHRLMALRNDPETRRRFRELLRRYANESTVRIVPEDQPGKAMTILGKVVDVSDGSPVPDALLYVYHTDHEGLYGPANEPQPNRNPQIFGFVRTNAEGEFEIKTIQPAPYPGASAGAAHVHFALERDGYATVSDEFRPYTHPADPSRHAKANRAGRPTSVFSEVDGVGQCRVTLPLSRRQR